MKRYGAIVLVVFSCHAQRSIEQDLSDLEQGVSSAQQAAVQKSGAQQPAPAQQEETAKPLVEGADYDEVCAMVLMRLAQRNDLGGLREELRKCPGSAVGNLERARRLAQRELVLSIRDPYYTEERINALEHATELLAIEKNAAQTTSYIKPVVTHVAAAAAGFAAAYVVQVMRADKS